MSKYDIFAISMSNLIELGPRFHSLWHMFPVRLIMSGVLLTIKSKIFNYLFAVAAVLFPTSFESRFRNRGDASSHFDASTLPNLMFP